MLRLNLFFASINQGKVGMTAWADRINYRFNASVSGQYNSKTKDMLSKLLFFALNWTAFLFSCYILNIDLGCLWNCVSAIAWLCLSLIFDFHVE